MPKENPLFAAILLMAGSGMRFKDPIPKQFHRLSGKRVYLHTLEALLNSALFSEIVLVTHEEWCASVQEEIQRYPGIIKVITGGKTRQESSYLGLLALSDAIDYILIHDAVRPFVSKAILEENLKKVLHYQAVDTCIPSHDTIITSLDGALISDIPHRAYLQRGQTPQTFAVPLIKKAHENAKSERYFESTDDCSLVKRLPHPVAIAQGSEENIKITSELDLILAENILRYKIVHTLEEKPATLEGKKYIITGGSGTIGKALIQKLQAFGAKTIAVSRNAPSYRADLQDSEAAKAVFDRIYQEESEVDGLINCVGKLIVKPFEELTDREMEELVRSNLLSTLYSCKYARIKPGGHIINFASSSYIQGRKEMATYSATKSAIVNFTQGLSEEKRSLHVNAIAPKRTQSSMREKFFPHEKKEELLDPEIIAEKTLSLLQSKGITGSVFRIF